MTLENYCRPHTSVAAEPLPTLPHISIDALPNGGGSLLRRRNVTRDRLSLGSVRSSQFGWATPDNNNRLDVWGNWKKKKYACVAKIIITYKHFSYSKQVT